MKRQEAVIFKQALLRPLTVSGTANPLSQTSLPSQEELSRVDYCGNMVYDRGERRLLLENGYVTFDLQTNAPSYHFYLRDHLGNNRVVFDQTGTVEQVTHYYPFGGVMRESMNPGLQPYKYGGKELDRTSGLDAYDFGARMYFADRLQWGQMDPLCEKYYEVSPYVYCLDNPIKFIDIYGMAPGDRFKNPTLAAIDFGITYNVESIKRNKEMASFIYKMKHYCPEKSGHRYS